MRQPPHRPSALLPALLATLVGAAAPPAAAQDGVIHSVVVLMDEPRGWGEAALVARLNEALGVELQATNEPADGGYTYDPPVLYFALDGLAYQVSVIDTPYVADPDAVADAVLAQLDNVALAEGMRRHRAWLSVDLIDGGSWPEGLLPVGYDVIGRAAAGLIEDGDTVLYAPATGDMRQLNVVQRERLAAGGDVRISVFGSPGLAPVPGDAPEMLAAIARARAEYPAFVDTFVAGGAPEAVVKAAFTDPDDPGVSESMWVRVEAIGPDGGVTGELINQPGFLTHVRRGDTVRLPSDTVQDFGYTDAEGNEHGRYTVEAINQLAAQAALQAAREQQASGSAK